METALQTIATLIVGIIGGGGGLATLLKVRHDQRNGVRATDIAEDTAHATAQDRLIERLENRLERVEDRLSAAEDGNVAKALLLRAQGDHIDVLEDWIWKQKSPPPPQRPAGL